MAESRTLTALAGLVIGLAVSAAVWYFLDSVLLFLFLPFVPVWWWRQTPDRPLKRCSTCGFQAREPEVAYCPRDGTRLVEENSE